MTREIAHYLCPRCAAESPYTADLRTGTFLYWTGQLPYVTRHGISHPNKPTGSFFLDTGAADFNARARYAGQSGWLGFEVDGGVVAFANFPTPIAWMENLGVKTSLTTTGKFVLLHVPDHRHQMGCSGFAGPEPMCSGCAAHWHS